MSEKQEKVSVSVRMPAELYEALKILALAEERSLSKQIIHAINEWMQAGKDEDDDRIVESSLNDDGELVIDWVDSDGVNRKRAPALPKPMVEWTAEIAGQTGKEVTGTIVSYNVYINPNVPDNHEISFRLDETINFSPASLLQSQIKFVPRPRKKKINANQTWVSTSYSPSVSPSPSEAPYDK